MITSTKIFTTHENPERADPADRMELVREGFSWGAFVFHVLWLFYQRLWLAAAVYMVALGMLAYAGGVFHLSPISVGAMQIFFQAMLGMVGFDLKRWALARRGYRLTGVVVAESELRAAQRYYDAAA